MDFEYKEEYSKLTNACLNLTDACNLQCKYCFVTQQPHYMDLDTAKDAIDWLITNKRWKEKQLKCNETVKVTYFGGEPTLLWDEIIVPLTEYALKKYPKEITFGITTNGTLLNEDKIKFMSKHNFSLLLSIDGAPKTQNYNRPCHTSTLSSFDLVQQNIPYILHYFPNTTFRATIDEDTVENTFENYIFAQYMGFKNIFMIPNGRNLWSQDKLNILKNEFEKIYTYMIYFFNQGKNLPINFSEIDKSFKMVKENQIYQLSPKKKRRNCIRCGLGTGMGSIGYNGNIYGCQEQNSQEKSSHFYIGDIYNGIDINKHSSLLKEYLNVEKVVCGEKPDYCNTCPLINICGEYNCPSSSYDLFQSLAKDNYVHCFWYRVMYELAEKTLLLLQNNDSFRYYLINNCGYSHLEQKGE